MILKTRNYGEVEYYAFSLTDMVSWGYDKLRNVGATTSQGAVQGIPAVNRAARIRAEALASLHLCCYQGEGANRKKQENAWQSKLFYGRANQWQTRFGFWETVGESLAYRNNAYIWKNTDPLSAQIFEWFALHPDQVECKGAGEYEVEVSDGYLDPVGRGKGRYRVNYETILHIRGHGSGGELEAPSPIKLFKETFSSALSRQAHENRMWRRGTSLQVAIEFPGGVSKEQVDEFRPAWEAAYEGTGGATTAVIGGGANIKPIGMTLEDAQFVELAKLTVFDASRIMGVPAGLLGAQVGNLATPLEQDLATWLRFGLGPELDRIESHLMADYSLFPSYGRSIYPAFETDEFVVGDVMTEDTVAHQRVQDGRILVDEWRASKGLPPLPGGAGKVPQVVPVGGGPNPNSNGANSNGKAPAEKTPA